MELDVLNDNLNKTKISLMSKQDSTFFTTVCFSLKFKWDESCPTAHTNGTVIGFNPDFYMSMPADERVGVLVHEAMHVAYLHMDRLGDRNHSVFNAAADHVINLQLLERGFKLPSFVLADKRFKGMGTEEVYKILMEERTQGQPQPQNQMEDLREADNTAEGLKEHVQDILVRAAIQSKMAGDSPGSIPGDIQIFLDNLLNPKLPWNRILMKYTQKYAKADYSFHRPNRRFAPKHYLPVLHSESMIDIAIATDVSGSVTDEEFKRCITESYSILKMLKPEKITLIQFDTGIRGTDTVRNVSDFMKVKFTGRGGTRISPVIEWANEHKPKILLIFSDGYFRFHGDTTNVDTIWLIHGNKNFKAPFGKVIHYEV